MVKRLSFVEQCLVRIMCALALLFLGVAHKTPVIDFKHIPPSEMAQYTLPDNSFPVLCLPSEDGKKQHRHTETSCEACRLTAAVLLPVPTDVSGQYIPQPAKHIVPTPNNAFYRQLFPPNTFPRGPPSSRIA